jgi:hypothetical protein
MTLRVGFSLLAALVAAPAFAAKPQIQWNTAYDFSTIKTFQWQDAAGESLKESDPFLHGHIINAIQYQLSASGLTEVTENPDVYVNYTASTRRDVRLESDTYGYSFGGYGYGWGHYGYGYGYPVGPIGPVQSSTRVVEIERGTLVVDIWAAASKELVWRGTAAELSVSDDPDKNRRNAEKAIEAMAKQSKRLREKK